MSGLDDILGGLTKSGGKDGGGLDDLLGRLLGGGSGGGGGLQDVLGGLLGGGSGGGTGTAAGGMNMGALAAALAPLVMKLLKGGGVQKLMDNAQASGLSTASAGTSRRASNAARRRLSSRASI